MAVQSRPRGLFRAWIVAVVLLTGMIPVAADSDAASISFGIDTVQNGMQGETVTISVYKFSGSQLFYGFDFLIAYDTVTLTLAGVTAGEVFDIPGSYEWEYFSYTADSSGIPTGLIHSIGIADTGAGGHHPAAYQIPDSMVMFTLDFIVTPDSTYNCTWNPILFYWKDCGDNALALDSLGIELGISSQVYVYGAMGYMDITDPLAGFPGYYGAPDDCLTGPTVTREIDYYGGGIDIHCTDEIDDRGDINCNAIPYEIADFVQFSNYFLIGLEAFGEHAECSQGNSDANADGIELQLEDLIYIYRVIVGDAVPYPRAYPRDIIPMTFTQDNDTKTISLDYNDSLAAIQLVFDGEITPTVLIDIEGVSWGYQYDGSYTRVIVLPDDFQNRAPHFIAEGTFMTYTGDALLIEARAADYFDNVFHASIESFGSGLTIPYTFEIRQVPNAPLGGSVSIPVVKTTGSMAASGFDFLIGYDASALTVADISPGILFDIPGAYEWEYFSYRFGPFDCTYPECPSGLLRVVALAETNDGAHHPLDLEIPDGTTLFTIECDVTADLTFEDLNIPMRYVWIDCGDNGVAFGSLGDSLALSDHVYDYTGVEITDPGYGLPGIHGAPDTCFENPTNPPVRFANFRNGGLHIVSIDSMKLIVTIDSVAADQGDTAIYVDVHLSNPQDSVVGFSLHVLMSQPDLVEFGRSPDDTIALDIENTLISDWEFIHQRSLTGTYHDLRIDAISNNTPPYTKGIPPGYDGILLRLIVHSYADIPEVVTDSTTRLIIDELPDQTGFSDPNGILIGLSGMQYDSMTVAFRDGFVTIEGPVPGDADGDGTVSLADAVFIIVYIFGGGPAPDPLCLGDADCDGVVNLSDAVYIINYVFKGGDPPVPACCP